jgi:hypothetical protein
MLSDPLAAERAARMLAKYGSLPRRRETEYSTALIHEHDVGPHSANQSLSTVEPVSAPPKWKLKNGEQRPEPKTRRARIEIPKLADQRLGTPA